MESAAFPGRDPAQETLENDVTAHQALAWAPFLMTLFAIVITYSRLPVTDFYHVGVDGLAGGLGRALVHLNFPVSIAGKTGTAEKEVRLPGYPNPVRAAIDHSVDLSHEIFNRVFRKAYTRLREI